MDQPVTAVLDACVLFSAPVRDLLIRLAQAGLIRARWTAEIHDEWMRNVLKIHSHLDRHRLERTRRLMDEAIRDVLVTGYEGLITDLTLPDPDDRHVLAAAIHAKAGVIVTSNLRDFPTSILGPHGIVARHPDLFIEERINLATVEACSAIRLQRESLKNPPLSVNGFLGTLKRVGLPRAAARLREFEAFL